MIRDEREPDPRRRYKAIFSNEHNMGRYPAVSPDGFGWTFAHVPPVPSEDTSQFIYDEIGQQFVATVKRRTEWGRSVWLIDECGLRGLEPSRRWSYIPTRWTGKTVGVASNRSSKTRPISRQPVVEDADYIAQLYMMPLTTYEGVYVGFPLLFNPAGPDLPQMNHCGINQVELAVSRDLYSWQRVADRAVFIGIEPWDGVNYGTCQVAVCGPPDRSG